MIKFHPSPEQLSAFAEGTLSPALSIMVAAHCDMCEKCMAIVEAESARLAKENIVLAPVSQHDDLMSDDMKVMMANITQLPSSLGADDIKVDRKDSDAVSIELDGRKFALPRALHRYASKTGSWSSMVGKLWQAPVDMGAQGVANFIYMGQGGSVPEHTHRGTEYTLVINGEFSDGLNDYDTGDFIYMDGEHTHTPRTDDHEGCLVFSIVDQPLHFTSGLARLLNPFSHLFFR